MYDDKTRQRTRIRGVSTVCAARQRLRVVGLPLDGFLQLKYMSSIYAVWVES